MASNGITPIPNFVKTVSPDSEVEKRYIALKPHFKDSNLKYSNISEGLLLPSSGSSTTACLVVQIHPIYTSALDKGQEITFTILPLYPQEKSPCNQRAADWVGTRAPLDVAV